MAMPPPAAIFARLPLFSRLRLMLRPLLHEAMTAYYVATTVAILDSAAQRRPLRFRRYL